MITAGVESKGHIPIQATTTVGFREGFLAVTNIIFAYRTSIIGLSYARNSFFRLPFHMAEMT